MNLKLGNLKFKIALLAKSKKGAVIILTAPFLCLDS